MSIKIDEKIIENMTILAQMNLSKDEIDETKEEMGKMLEYMEKLKELDTEDVMPMYQVFPESNVFREDIVINNNERKNILENAPESQGYAFVVPKTFN